MALGEELSSTLVVEVDGRPLPSDVMATLVNGYVDDSSNVPDMFVLRFTDEGATALTKGGFSIGVAVRLLVQTSSPGGPQLLLTGEVTSVEIEVSAPSCAGSTSRTGCSVGAGSRPTCSAPPLT
jgi:hypothetical protein